MFILGIIHDPTLLFVVGCLHITSSQIQCTTVFDCELIKLNNNNNNINAEYIYLQLLPYRGHREGERQAANCTITFYFIKNPNIKEQKYNLYDMKVAAINFIRKYKFVQSQHVF